MAGEIACARCGDFVDGASTLLSDTGDPICTGCNDRAELGEGEHRAASAIFATSGSAFGFGLIGCVVNPYFLMTVLGVLSALSTFGLVIRHPEYRKHLGWRLPATIVVASLGLLMSLLAPVVLVFLRIAL